MEPCIGDKVIFRIANGYAEETLLVVAERPSDGLRVEFEAIRVETQDELPGTFYPLNLAIPEPGSWQLYVMAGADEVIILVEVAPADNQPLRLALAAFGAYLLIAPNLSRVILRL